MDALRLLSRSTGLKTKATKFPVLPSQGPKSEGSTPDAPTSGGDQAPVSSHLGKRKWQDDSESQTYSEAECRRMFKQRKIKVVDLLHKHATSNKKAQKQAAQIFPQPLTSFIHLRSRYSIGQPLLNNIADQSYHQCTAVQLVNIPLLLQDGKQPDLLTVAPTGSGKTLAFLLPVIHKLSRGREGASARPRRHPGAFIIAPTKELVSQIVNEGRKLTKGTEVKLSQISKGVAMDQVDVIVATPLTLINALHSESINHAQHITQLVLDEADFLLDLFREQTLHIWNACSNPNLRISLWSATIGSNIEELAIRTIQERQKRLQLTESNPLLRCVVGLKDSALPTVSHKLMYAATEPGKLLGLRQLLHPPSRLDGKRPVQPLRPPFLVFTQTIERASALYTELLYDVPSEAGGSERVAVLHSALSDAERSDMMSSFRAGQIWILITTDLLSRGIDFLGVNSVVNYDIPNTTAAYIHRAGRTGRAGREGGVCVTFYTKDDIKYVKAIANVISASTKGKDHDGKSGMAVQKWLLDALPDVNKSERKALKTRGVEHRRPVRENDDEKTARAKRKARINTKSGYEK